MSAFDNFPWMCTEGSDKMLQSKDSRDFFATRVFGVRFQVFINKYDKQVFLICNLRFLLKVDLDFFFVDAKVSLCLPNLWRRNPCLQYLPH